jgi:hypothetical protein
MTAYQFNNLPREEQLKIIQEYNGLLSFREDEHHRKVLIRVDDFFIETYYNISDNNCIDRIKAIESIEELLPWVFKLATKPSNTPRQEIRISIHLSEHEVYKNEIEAILKDKFPELEKDTFKDTWAGVLYLLEKNKNNDNSNANNN